MNAQVIHVRMELNIFHSSEKLSQRSSGFRRGHRDNSGNSELSTTMEFAIKSTYLLEFTLSDGSRDTWHSPVSKFFFLNFIYLASPYNTM